MIPRGRLRTDEIVACVKAHDVNYIFMSGYRVLAAGKAILGSIS